ncbi:hypothetical protein [Sinomonas humi]|uniref:hypothetical protein n=1 Tax=Sinomonas humi TaxID=1338436 RepID=UPI0012E0C3D1|nr:hypothetical protein [Sinomonas humi]
MARALDFLARDAEGLPKVAGTVTYGWRTSTRPFEEAQQGRAARPSLMMAA